MKTTWANILDRQLFFRLRDKIKLRLSWVLVCLTFFATNNVAQATTSTQTITIRKPDFQTPLAALEQYAQSILFKNVALAAVNFDWRAFPRLSPEHHAVLTRHYLPTGNPSFNIAGVTLIASKHDSDYYYFTFAYEEPPTITVNVDQGQMVALLRRVETSGQVDDIAAYIDIGLTDPALVRANNLATIWKRRFGYYSYDAVVLGRINHFGAVKFSAKQIALASLPPDLEGAWQLFDLAPFNFTVCNHLVSRLAPELAKLRHLLMGHCRAIGQLNNEDASWRSKKAQQKSMANRVELDRLSELFAFDVASRPLFFVLVASNGVFELAPSLIAPQVARYTDGSVDMEAGFTPHQLPNQYLSIRDMRQLLKFLIKNEMPTLAGLIETTITKYQTDLSKKQLDTDDLSSQFENIFGKY
jgi:hypothetical protein